MNNRISKKLRKLSRRNWREFYGDILGQPFKLRLGIAWYIVTHRRK